MTLRLLSTVLSELFRYLGEFLAIFQNPDPKKKWVVKLINFFFVQKFRREKTPLFILDLTFSVGVYKKQQKPSQSNQI